jgi:DNA-binding CsgD family transcriptional regulator
MHKTPISAPTSTDGFLLLNSSMTLVFFNRAAAQILTYPQNVEAHKNVGEHIAARIRSKLISADVQREGKIVSRYQSGKRVYVCRSFQLSALSEREAEPSVAILLERGTQKQASLDEVSEKFRLTRREQEIIQHLLQGMTSKEIAMRMGISANTVKAFLRLIMVKMAVTTRSGIVGKTFTTTVSW